MNELSSIFVNLNDGETVTLEKNRVYDVRPEDSFIKTGYFCSNSAKKEENPEGTRYSAIYLKNKKNITIDGNGATVLVHGKMTPLLFYGCENLTVKNLRVDYAVPTMTEFSVLERNGSEIIIKINPDCLFEVDGSTLYWKGEDDLNGVPYWKNASSAPKRYVKVLDPDTEFSRDFRREDLSFSEIQIIGENTLKCTLANEDVVLSKGEIIQTRNIIRDQVGSMSERCKDITFENMRIMFMHGLGMVSQYCENVTFRSCDLTPKEGRTIASTADFFQFSGCKGTLTIENCRAFGAQDDYVNVHGTHLSITKADYNEKSLILSFRHPETWGFQAYEKGDIIEFIRWDTLIPYGNAEVLSYEKISDTEIKVITDFLPEGITEGKDAVENATWTPDVKIRNCDFGRTCGRGILATTRGEVIIENNRFYKLWGQALLIEDDCNFWFESGYTKNVIFRNNDVVSCNFNHNSEGAPVIQYSPKVMNESSEEFVHGRLLVCNNKFLSPVWDKHTMSLAYLNSAEICNNTFDSEYEIFTKCVGEIKDKNNTVLS